MRAGFAHPSAYNFVMKIQLLFALLAGWLPLVAHAFPIGPQPPGKSHVVEYFNTHIGHYFYTADFAEITGIDAGAAGPGWEKTGLVFAVFSSVPASGNGVLYPTCDKDSSPCMPISRFYGTPGLGPNSHFYIGDAGEAAGLKQPNTGWTFEKVAFVVPLPNPATGQCAEGLAPVYRFYNGRWAANDSNHRYTASEDARNRMRAAGWIDEGVAFCAYSRGWAQVESYRVAVPDQSGIVEFTQCDAPTALPRSCVALRNLPIPKLVYPVAEDSWMQSSDEFNAKTGSWQAGSSITQNVAAVSGTRAAASNGLFVQLSETVKEIFGLHLSTASSGVSPYSSMGAMMRLPEARLFPFKARYETSYEVRFRFQSSVATVVAGFNSSAYGVSTMEYQDSRSGRRLRANLLAYGTGPSGDFVGRDAKDGVLIVASTYRGNMPYGRVGSIGSGNRLPFGGGFDVAVNAAEFQSMLNAARAVDPEMSADPSDYFLRSFGVFHEIFGTGEMGVYLYGPAISILPI